MVKSKRGLSDIVSNVLIILLVIVAVGIIAGVLIPGLKDSSSKITGTQACLNLDIGPVSCKTSVAGTNVTVKRDKGDEIKVVQLKIILDKSDGTQYIGSDIVIPGLYESSVYRNVSILSATGVKTAAKIQTADGKQTDCLESQRIACTA